MTIDSPSPGSEPPDSASTAADEDTTSAGDPSDSDETLSGPVRESNTLLNALLGATVTVTTAFLVPLSPVLGGIVAGYLEGADAGSGLKVGALSGLLALIPLLIVVPLGLLLFVLEPIAAAGVLILVTIAIGFLAVYTVGFGMLGGLLGVYLYREFNTRRKR